jgi:hypothetical protein|tara:strand:+ start:2732 stop:3970 length:1239 start_codon:yes stop_codon:yes gene_type:complete
MIERVEKELNSLATRLSIEVGEMNEKYTEIGNSNNLDLEDERQQLVALTLTRNYVRGRLASNRTASKGFGDSGTGFFIGIEPARDVMEWKRKSVMSKYNSDSSQALNDEIVAEVTMTDAGYEKTQKKNGEWDTRIIPQLPASAIEVNETTWVVPVDPVKSWASGDVNKNYGKPLPKEEFKLRAHFVGMKEDGDVQLWTLQLKNDQAKNFNVETFRWTTIFGLFNDERNAIYGIRGKTLESLNYIDVLDEEDPRWIDTSGDSMEDLLVEHMAEYVADLIELESYHELISQQQGLRLVVTDGIVTSMNLTPNERSGNRVMWVEPVDANYGFDEDDIPESTPIWVPSHLDINFGVGSDVVVVGRTNQTQKKDENGMPLDGEYNPVTINLYGVYARTATGVVVEDVEEDGESMEYW